MPPALGFHCNAVVPPRARPDILLSPVKKIRLPRLTELAGFACVPSMFATATITTAGFTEELLLVITRGFCSFRFSTLVRLQTNFDHLATTATRSRRSIRIFVFPEFFKISMADTRGKRVPGICHVCTWRFDYMNLNA